MKNYEDESDLDFWVDFDKDYDLETGGNLLSVPKGELGNSRRFVAFDTKENVLKSPIGSQAWTREYFEDKLLRLRQSQEPEIISSTIKATNQVKRIYDDRIEDMKVKSLKDISMLVSEFTKLKQMLVSRDSYIKFLLQLLGDASLYFTESNISSMKKKIQPRYSPELDLEKQSLSDEINNLRSQNLHLKDICYLLQKDYDLALYQMKLHRDEIESQKKKYEEEIKKLKDVISSKDKLILEDRSKHSNEIENLKNSYEKEIVAREEVQSRQGVFIGQLQDEIKNAKIVLQNKHVRQKYYSSLKEYQEDIDKKAKWLSTKASAKTTIHQRTESVCKRKSVSSAKRSTVYDSMALEKGNRMNTTFMNNGGHFFTGKMSSSIFNTFDHYQRPSTPSNRRHTSNNL